MATLDDRYPAGGGDAGRSRSWFPIRIGLKPLAQMCHNVGTGLHAGVDIRRIWETEAARGSMRHRSAMSQIRDQVAAGDTVTEAIAASGGYFPGLLKEMVDVGERTGRLDQVFVRLGEHYDNLLRMRRMFLMGIAWPMIELTLGLCVIGLFIWILGMIPQTKDGPPITFFGLYGNDGLLIYVSVVGGIFALIAGTIFGVRNGWFNVDPLVRLAMGLPGIGHGLKTVAMSRMTWSLSMATDTEIDARKVVELAVRTTQNPHYTSKIERIQGVIERGGEMREAFESAGVFPDDFLDALHAGEISGRISESMLVLAKDYEDRTKLYYRGLAVAAGIGVFLLVAALIIFLIFTLFMQYLNILDSAGTI